MADFLDFSELKKITGFLSRFISFLNKSTDPVVGTVDRWFRGVEKDLFASEGASGASGRWAPLARSTVEQKTREGYGSRKILERTGALAASLTRANAQYAVREVTGDSIKFTTSHPAAAAHQKGTARMPARKVIDPTDTQLTELEKDVAQKTNEELGKIVFGG